MKRPSSGSFQPRLSTGQAARLLGVHPSTVKRWFEERSGAATEGGHRRIPLSDVLSVGAERGHESYLRAFEEDAGLAWKAVDAADGDDFGPLCRLFYRWLKAGRAHYIGHLLGHLDDRGQTSARLLDGAFAGCMHMVGDAWEEGRLRVGEERAASREVVEALLGIVTKARADRGPGRPTAVVGAMEGDQHYMGPLLVRTLLTTKGWTVEYLGPDVPLEEFVVTQKAHTADLVCVSFTPPMGPPDVRRCVEVLGDLMDPALPFALAVGGGGSKGAELAGRPDPFIATVRADSLVGLGQWIDQNWGADRG